MKTSCQVAKAGVTRRGFLGLAAASAVIAGSGIAGCAPAKPSKTDADAEQAQTALEIAESEIKETKRSGRCSGRLGSGWRRGDEVCSRSRSPRHRR